MHEEFLNRDLNEAAYSAADSQLRKGGSMPTSSPGENVQPKVQKGAAIAKMRMIAQDIYESTKGIADEIPRHTSKILQNVKGDKKSKAGASSEPVKYTKYEAWEKMYRDKL